MYWHIDTKGGFLVCSYGSFLCEHCDFNVDNKCSLGDHLYAHCARIAKERRRIKDYSTRVLVPQRGADQVAIKLGGQPNCHYKLGQYCNHCKRVWFSSSINCPNCGFSAAVW
jgi:hypothetical protein